MYIYQSARATYPLELLRAPPPPPCSVEYTLEVLRGGSLLHAKPVAERDHYTFGRTPDCDVVLEHPSASRLHAVLQYNGETKVWGTCGSKGRGGRDFRDHSDSSGSERGWDAGQWRERRR